MEALSSHDITTIFFSLAIMLAMARTFGELFSKIGQPSIVGEIVAGIILGPTILGTQFPEFFALLFPSDGATPLAFTTINTIAVVLLLLIAGLEVDLSALWRQGRAALLVSIFGVVIPFGMGFGAAYAAPGIWGVADGADHLTFSLFVGTALSISALPVAARILMDLGVFKSDIGMLIMGAAMFNDLIGWIIFSIVLGMMHGAGGADAAGHGAAGMSIWATIGLTLGIAVGILTLLRSFVHRALPWIQARFGWPGGVLSFVLVLAFAGAAATEAIGVHAIFGAFLVGIAIGDSKHLREHTRTILHQFVTNIFAPIFFVSIGLHVNFLAGFNPVIVGAVLLISFVGKSSGSFLGARWGGLSKRESLAVASGMNAHGAMEIILGLLALENGIITEEMFIALVVLAVAGAVSSGPLMRMFIVRPKEWKLVDLIQQDLIVSDLQSTTRDAAIVELATVAAAVTPLSSEVVADAVLARERLMGTGIGQEIALPHARLEGLPRPVLVLGHSDEGLDFNAPDGRRARVIVLLLTPKQDHAAQVQIIGQVARSFRSSDVRRMLYDGASADELRAAVKIEGAAKSEE